MVARYLGKKITVNILVPSPEVPLLLDCKQLFLQYHTLIKPNTVQVTTSSNLFSLQ